MLYDNKKTKKEQTSHLPNKYMIWICIRSQSKLKDRTVTQNHTFHFNDTITRRMSAAFFLVSFDWTSPFECLSEIC